MRFGAVGKGSSVCHTTCSNTVHMLLAMRESVHLEEYPILEEIFPNRLFMMHSLYGGVLIGC